MKTAARFAPLVATVLVISAAAFLMAAELHSVLPGDLKVHEWGTFTSVAGEDGSAVDWDTLGCKSDLPRFVNDYGYRGFKWGLQGTVRMETPVLYFYSSRELDARVRIGFPQGLITEWYPQAETQIYQKSRSDGSLRQLSANLSGIDTSMRSMSSSIEWRNVKVQPGAAPTLSVESDPSHYYAARATDADPIMVGGQHEKFLFYRGVGRFPVLVSARLAGDGKTLVENRGPEPVPIVILFENRQGRIGYRTAGALKESLTLGAPSLDGSFPQLRQDLETALIAQGLFPKEAKAMLETWRYSWFEQGSRLIYIVPSPAVDATLRLQIEPVPSQTVRVFVGRIELVTPETKRLVESAIAKRDWSAIDRFGRFLGPILERIYSGNSSKATEIKQLVRNFQMSSGSGNCR
jgi:hypothetical protein